MSTGITVDEEKQIFLLQTEHTSCALALIDGVYLCQAYYGRKIEDTDLRYLLCEDLPPYTPAKNAREKNSFLDCALLAYPDYGCGDYREGAFTLEDADGFRGSELLYQSYRVIFGKPALEGLPATFGEKEEIRTLEITLADAKTGVQVQLSYSVFAGSDAIARSVLVRNAGEKQVYLKKVLSACLELRGGAFDVVSLHGSWARERHIQRIPLGYGRQNLCSFRGESSHQESPFLAICSKDAGEDTGDVYAMNFVYSGNFLAQAERSQFDTVRMTMGIYPENFSWKLEPGETFQAPEVIQIYSAEGFGRMTRCFHDLYRNHLIRSPWLHRDRPVLVNNWEATYFNFDEEKILSIARKAKELGIEMLVLDDGWFGKRNSDDSSLGDWTVNREKLPGGLSGLSEKIHAMGLKFGLWVEPEMISPDSDLFRAHPDWAIAIPGRETTQSRAQYVLDLTREEVVEEISARIRRVLREAKADYVKWDMNRQLTTLGSLHLPADRQGELCHRYVLALYRMQEQLLKDFPDLLLENCSGGGARFDAGMLYYSPQIWCSDDTDAIERLEIQEGTALCCPVSCMGSHVSVCPNHTVGRVTPFATRGIVALTGTFGYELDLTKLSKEEEGLVREQIRTYHASAALIREGDYYRLSSLQNGRGTASWMFVSKDQRQALVFVVRGLAGANEKAQFLKLKGLRASFSYRIEENGQTGSGALWQNAGLRLEPVFGDFQACLFHLKSV